MKIGILGGSFDPPHNGHLLVAKSLIKQKLCNKVILMPVFKHPFGKPITDGEQRFAMTKLLASSFTLSSRLKWRDLPQQARNDIFRTVSENRNIEVSDLEIKKEQISYTIDTLNTLKTQSPNDDFVWIIGSDQIKDFRKWKKWREIVERFGLIIVPRTDISSSEIRKRVKEGLSISNLVPKEVERYIISHKLYL